MGSGNDVGKKKNRKRRLSKKNLAQRAGNVQFINVRGLGARMRDFIGNAGRRGKHLTPHLNLRGGGVRPKGETYEQGLTGGEGSVKGNTDLKGGQTQVMGAWAVRKEVRDDLAGP